MKPPRFHPDGDLQDWRKLVAEWVATIKMGNDLGKDRSIKTKYALLACIFYSESLPDAQKSLVDDEISKGVIGLYNDDDPVQTVLKIVNIVAIDAPIAQITRLINTYQSVISCTRKKDERLSIFASRFRGLASKHLRYCGASTSSQTGQILAITLLNNARLDDIVLTNAKMQLIVLAQDRAKNAEDENYRNTIPLSNLEPALMYAEELKEKCEEHPMEDVDGEEKLKDDFIDEVRNGSDHIFKMLESARNAAQKQPSEEVTLEEMFKDKSVVIKLHLDDAVSVLRNIGQGSQSQPSFTAAEVQYMVAAQVSAYLSNHGRGGSLANAAPTETAVTTVTATATATARSARSMVKARVTAIPPTTATQVAHARRSVGSASTS